MSQLNRWMLARAFVRILLVDVRLRMFGLGDFLTATGDEAAGEVTSGDLRKAYGYAAWIQVAARYHPVRARCLHQSLALHTWLRHDGLRSRLRIGVRKDGAVLKAHAWVECDGHIVNDSELAVSAFTPLLGLDVPGRFLSRGSGAKSFAWQWE